METQERKEARGQKESLELKVILVLREKREIKVLLVMQVSKATKVQNKNYCTPSLYSLHS